MKKILIAGIVFVSSPFVSFAQTTTTPGTTTVTTTAPAPVVTTIAPGLIPGDFFYFLDRWTEALNLAFTFNNENKARKHLEYAKERVAEMGEVLKNPDAALGDVALAKEDYATQVSLAANLVKSEQEKGADVKNIARELDDELDSTREELRGILKEHKDKSSRAEEEIRAKLAALSPNDPQVQGLTQALESITKEKVDADNEEKDIATEIKDEQALFEEMMGKELSTEKQLEEVMKLRDLVGQGLPEGSLKAGDAFMQKAEEAIKRGDFEKAKKFSEDAQRAIEKVREAQDDGEEKSVDGMNIKMEDGANDAEINNLESDIKNIEDGIKHESR